METVFDPRLGVMVDRRTGLPVSGNATSPQSVNVLAQMLNGTGIPERVNALNSLFNPVVALGEAGQHSQNMLAPGRAPMQRVSDAGQMLTGMAGTVVPMWAASRGAVPTTNALVDAMTGINLPGGEFLVDEFGGVRLPGGGIRAYHGSPHSFDKFSMDKIGTGEGAQAYGHGLYFAENEGVAKAYRDNLAGLVPYKNADGPVSYWDFSEKAKNAALSVPGTHPDQVGQIVRQIETLLRDEKTVAKIKANYAPPRGFERQWNAALDAVGDLKFAKNKGSMYEVRINANPDDFLDWDKPWRDQPQKVRAWFDEKIDAKYRDIRGRYPHVEELSGGDALADVQNMLFAPAEASERLKEAGIPGIKYLDAGSRGAGDGSRNYVVFDENLIEIVRKYGIAGAAAMLGVSAMDVEQAMAGEK